MTSRDGSRRCLLAAGTLLTWSAASLLLAWSTGSTVAQVSDPGPAPPDQLLALSAAVAAWLLLSWMALVILVAVLAAAPARAGGALSRVADKMAPAIARRAVAALLGVAVVGGPAIAPGAALASPAASSIELLVGTAELRGFDPVDRPAMAHDDADRAANAALSSA
ncbi:MAG: hypothetical protein ACRDRH_26420, partial [Pseudonocardia sp.]